MTTDGETGTPAVREDLLTALEVIETQPLDGRADGYAALHDELSRRLESGPRETTVRG